MKKIVSIKTFSVILVCLLCLGLGWYIRGRFQAVPPAILGSKFTEVRQNSDIYHYINPLLLIDFPREAPEYSSLKKNITDYITTAKHADNISSISVYFQDLNSGKGTGVNQDELYDPSSMLKVAVMIGYLNAADNNPEVLLKKLNYIANDNQGQYYKPLSPLKTGSYTVLELINAIIIDSDNTALELLYNNDRAIFINVLKELDIPPPSSINEIDFMSPKTYSKVFRTLFSSTYLTRDLSEKALQLLTYTTFKNGLVSGVSSSTIVAHKFGEHTTVLNGTVTSHQLHDCGIVYFPHKPYFLCVMTRGQDFKKLESVISDISNITYKNIGS